MPLDLRVHAYIRTLRSFVFMQISSVPVGTRSTSTIVQVLVAQQYGVLVASTRTRKRDQ
jgi:hypothetical protein